MAVELCKEYSLQFINQVGFLDKSESFFECLPHDLLFQAKSYKNQHHHHLIHMNKAYSQLSVSVVEYICIKY